MSAKLFERALGLEEPWFVSGVDFDEAARVLALAREMPFAAVARIVGESAHRVQTVCEHYVEAAMAETDLSAVRALAVDETSRARGHDYVTLGGRTRDPPRALCRRGARRGEDRGVCRRASGPRLSPRADWAGLDRHVARLYCGLWGVSSCRPDHLRQVPCGRSRLHGGVKWTP